MIFEEIPTVDFEKSRVFFGGESVVIKWQSIKKERRCRFATKGNICQNRR
jgi:hypothetical protein